MSLMILVRLVVLLVLRLVVIWVMVCFVRVCIIFRLLVVMDLELGDLNGIVLCCDVVSFWYE